MTIENVLTRRQVFNQRFAGGEAIAAENILKRIYAKINERLLRDPTEFQQLNMTRIRNDINNILAIDLVDMKEVIVDGALDFAEAEGEFMYTALSSETSVVLALPAIEQIKQAVVQAGMDVVVGSGTLTINEALDKFAVNKGVEIRAAINDGILTGQTNQQIAAQIKDYGDNLHKGQINALVRTSINNASTQARRIVTEENQNILKGDEWVATLDSRTTLICGGRDGNIYPINSGPFPPAHWNCRSLRVPVVKDEFRIDDGLGRRPEVGADGPKAVSSKRTFDTFLRDQPADFQDEYFSQFPDGLAKAALYRRGKLPIQRFRDETGRNYTLAQLKALEPIAFNKANIII
jgi:SPP1 gp7 family putative phage head morphogenesis protein